MTHLEFYYCLLYTSFEAYNDVTLKMANLDKIEVIAEKSADASSFMAVSYTHLDVYKRQGKYRFNQGNGFDRSQALSRLS